MLILFYALIGAAIAAMLFGLYLAIRLKQAAPGGTVGKVVNALLVLIVMFTVGYLVAPFSPRLPQEAVFLLVAVVFFFGAVYVILVLWLIRNLIRKVMDELKI